MNNLSRAVGHDVSDRFAFVSDKDSLMYKYMKAREEVLRPLQRDPWNTRGKTYDKKIVEKEVQKLVEKCLMSEIGRVEDVIANGVVDVIEKELNAIPQMKGGGNGNTRSTIATTMTIKLTQGLVDIIDKIVKNSNK